MVFTCDSLSCNGALHLAIHMGVLSTFIMTGNHNVITNHTTLLLELENMRWQKIADKCELLLRRYGRVISKFQWGQSMIIDLNNTAQNNTRDEYFIYTHYQWLQLICTILSWMRDMYFEYLVFSVYVNMYFHGPHWKSDHNVASTCAVPVIDIVLSFLSIWIPQ